MNACRRYKKPAWKNYHKVQNPDLINDMPINDYHGEDTKQKRTRFIHVCGLGIYGALGMKKFYNLDSSLDETAKTKFATVPTPQRLRVFHPAQQIRDVACGYGFTLVATTAEDTSHTVFGFGLNNFSQLGYHATKPNNPLEVVTSASPIHVRTKFPIEKVACGRSHSVLVDADQQVFTLGDNSFGQCGRKIKEDEEYFGSQVITSLNDVLPRSISQVVCGQDHTFFVTKDGQLYSCGWGADGQTGLGHYNNQDKPALVKGDIHKEKIVKISSASDTILAINERGDLFGWGNSEYAQFRRLLGQDDAQFNVPRHLKLRNVPGKIVDIAAGGTLCSLLTDTGHVYVWGFGILGMGPKVDHLDRPARIAETLFGQNASNQDVKVVGIYANLSHFAAITNLGDLYMWGKNRYGCLGFAHKNDQYFPWRVNIPSSQVIKVALGVDHTCILSKPRF